MKEYTNSEVIKVLFDNPKLIAEAINEHGDKYHLFINHNGYLYFKRWNSSGKYLDPRKHSGGHFNGNIDRKIKWHIIPQPVPWQEALQAWALGKSIKCVADNVVVYSGDSYYAVNSAFGRGISKNEISNGTWYILEDPND